MHVSSSCATAPPSSPHVEYRELCLSISDKDILSVQGLVHGPTDCISLSSITCMFDAYVRGCKAVQYVDVSNRAETVTPVMSILFSF